MNVRREGLASCEGASGWLDLDPGFVMCEISNERLFCAATRVLARAPTLD
jgi:hypothetical protein